MIGCLTLSLKREEVLVHKAKRPLVECVEQNIVGDYLVRMDNHFGCGKSVHKVRYSPNVNTKTRGVGKIKQAVLMLMLQERIAFMISTLGEQDSSTDMVTGM